MSKEEEIGINSKSETDKKDKSIHPMAKLEILLSNNKERSKAFLEAFFNAEKDLGIKQNSKVDKKS